ncbi:MAG: fluoride efflux transporter CrcB [Bacteroidales bacterium]|nr:fluoride efflux transporter CrcB [Bacteroidales bacterium]MDD4673075.1 fluoride efflux transporter CrcB [Bacteroidales bacterium]
MIKNLLIVALGGGIGTVLRYLISSYLQKGANGAFPWGTFTVNIVGSLIIGVLYGLSERGEFMTNELKLLLVVGLCGGFTTFSAFTNEIFTLTKGGEFLQVALYTSLSVTLGFLFVYLGYSTINLTR